MLPALRSPPSEVRPALRYSQTGSAPISEGLPGLGDVLAAHLGVLIKASLLTGGSGMGPEILLF